MQAEIFQDTAIIHRHSVRPISKWKEQGRVFEKGMDLLGLIQQEMDGVSVTCELLKEKLPAVWEEMRSYRSK